MEKRKNSVTSLSTMNSQTSPMQSNTRNLTTGQMMNVDTRFKKNYKKQGYPGKSPKAKQPAKFNSHPLAPPFGQISGQVPGQMPYVMPYGMQMNMNTMSPINMQQMNMHMQQMALNMQQMNMQMPNMSIPMPQNNQLGNMPRYSVNDVKTGTYYFPNGEIFRPRVSPSRRNKPNKIKQDHIPKQPIPQDSRASTDAGKPNDVNSNIAMFQNALNQQLQQHPPGKLPQKFLQQFQQFQQFQAPPVYSQPLPYQAYQQFNSNSSSSTSLKTLQSTNLTKLINNNNSDPSFQTSLDTTMKSELNVSSSTSNSLTRCTSPPSSDKETSNKDTINTKGLEIEMTNKIDTVVQDISTPASSVNEEFSTPSSTPNAYLDNLYSNGGSDSSNDEDEITPILEAFPESVKGNTENTSSLNPLVLSQDSFVSAKISDSEARLESPVEQIDEIEQHTVDPETKQEVETVDRSPSRPNLVPISSSGSGYEDSLAPNNFEGVTAKSISIADSFVPSTPKQQTDTNKQLPGLPQTDISEPEKAKSPSSIIPSPSSTESYDDDFINDYKSSPLKLQYEKSVAKESLNYDTPKSKQEIVTPRRSLSGITAVPSQQVTDRMPSPSLTDEEFESLAKEANALRNSENLVEYSPQALESNDTKVITIDKPSSIYNGMNASLENVKVDEVKEILNKETNVEVAEIVKEIVPQKLVTKMVEETVQVSNVDKTDPMDKMDPVVKTKPKSMLDVLDSEPIHKNKPTPPTPKNQSPKSIKSPKAMKNKFKGEAIPLQLKFSPKTKTLSISRLRKKPPTSSPLIERFINTPRASGSLFKKGVEEELVNSESVGESVESNESSESNGGNRWRKIFKATNDAPPAVYKKRSNVSTSKEELHATNSQKSTSKKKKSFSLKDLRIPSLKREEIPATPELERNLTSLEPNEPEDKSPLFEPVADISLPTIETDDHLFDDMLNQFDEELEYVRRKSTIKGLSLTEPFLKDDELTRDQIEDQQMNDDDNNANGELSADQQQYSDDENADTLDFLKSEYVNMEDVRSFKSDASISGTIKSSRENEGKEETFILEKEQLHNLFDNINETQRRKLPMHLKYIKQFKDFDQIEVATKTFEHVSNDIKQNDVAVLILRKPDVNKAKVRVNFSNKICINETFSSNMYSRYNKSVTQYNLTGSVEITRIKNELNTYKCNEMLVHEKSQNNTHFFY